MIEHGGVRPNPLLSHVQAGIAMAKEHEAEVIVAVGGGSVLDSAKAICAGAVAPHDVWKFFTGKTVDEGKEVGPSGYQHDRDMTVSICDRAHPITWGLDTFTIHDETYNKYSIAPGVTPLLTTNDPTSDKVIGWTHVCGNSRVVYLQLGHDRNAFDDPGYRRLVAQAIQWTAKRD